MENPKMLSPSTMAFVGDAVFGLLVRTKLAEIERPVGELHKRSVDFVNAKYMEIKVYWDKKTIKIESNLPGKLVLNEYEVRFDKGGIYLEL